MAEGQQERREQEVARVRSYLASQAIRRTPEQLVEALREAHQQFLQAVAAVPEPMFAVRPHPDAWSALDVLEHVRAIATIEEQAIRAVVERGEQPVDVNDVILPSAHSSTKAALLADIETRRAQLIDVALHADPQAHLAIVWGHSEFGLMNWREWLLFARVHTLDHAHQIQGITATLLEEK